MLSVRIRPGLPVLNRLRILIIVIDQGESKRVKFSANRPKIAYEDLKLELKKVEWPTRAHVLKLTQTVFFIMILFLGVVGLVDFGLTKIIQVLRVS